MKIKRLLKYIIPIVLIVGVVICFLISRMQTPTGRDNVITGNVDLPQDNNGNYIAQRYESNLIPSDTGFTVNDQPVDNVIRVDNGESGNDSDYILVEIEEQDIKNLFKKEDLLDGHPTTDHNTTVTEQMINNNNYVDVEGSRGIENHHMTKILEDLAYDTTIIKRVNEDNKEAYFGMLYGKWGYSFTVEDQETYNITTELVIASHYSAIELDSITDVGSTSKLVLSEGCLDVMVETNETNLHEGYIKKEY